MVQFFFEKFPQEAWEKPYLQIAYLRPFLARKKKEKAHYLRIKNGYGAGCWIGLE